MTHINMTRSNMTRNALRNFAETRDSVAWGKNVVNSTWGNINALLFAAVLIACSLTVGCSSEQPKPVTVNNPISVPQPQSLIASAPAPMMQAENKPAPKKIVHKKPATVNYADKTYGVTFEYPRRYAIETGSAAAELVLSNPVPMNFVQPGGVALAAVELPETGFANTDFSSAFFNVSVHKTLTADQCTEFAVPAPKVVESSTSMPVTNSTATSATATSASSTEASASSTSASNASAATDSAKAAAPETQSASTQPATAGSSETKATITAAPVAAQPTTEPQGSKLLLGDMELRGTEAVSGEGTRQSDSKYFHVFQNGSCYEFALNVTTVASQDGLIKHVDRDKVFGRLEQILATVKIDPVKINPVVTAPEVTAETPATPAAAATPAQ